MTVSSPVIGVLSLQGSFSEHSASLRRLGATVREIRLPQDLEGIEGIILPGGESTTFLNLLDTSQLREPLREAISSGLPTLATCAGVIILARGVTTHDMTTLGVLDITVARNAFGRQTESFEEDLSIEGIEGPAFRGVFIRAPVIDAAGPDVRVLCALRSGSPVACRQQHVLATTFHPEFIPDLRLHQFFLHMVTASGRNTSHTGT